MACLRLDCNGRARIQEKSALHRQFCDTRCQTFYWLGETPRLSDEASAEQCTLRLLENTLEASFSVDVTLDEQTRALHHEVDEELGLARGTLCWPELRLAYRFAPQFDFLHWLDFALPVKMEDSTIGLLFALPIGGDTVIMVSHQLLVSAALRLATPPNLDTLREAFQQLAIALHSEEFGEVAQWDAKAGQFRYTRVEQVLCHLMYLHSQQLADWMQQSLSAIMRRGVRPLQVTSVQDYVAHALRPLGDLGRVSTLQPGTLQERHLVFALPALSEPGWNTLVTQYVTRQEYTPGAGMLRNARYVTIVAREPGEGGHLLGYVTSALYRPRPDATSLERLQVESWGSERMRQFARARNPNLYDLMLIEGLSVDREWRGGRHDSVAVLLVFHALYFALRLSTDCGMLRVSCQSAARTTALIMRQFGGQHCNPQKAVKWMEARLKQDQSCAEDLAAFAAEYEGSAALMVGSEREQVAALRAQLNSNFDTQGKNWKMPWQSMEQLLTVEDSDTFLYLGAENRQLHEQMARIERFLTEQAHKQPRANDDDLQGDERRKRVKTTGAPLLSLSLHSLDSFAL